MRAAGLYRPKCSWLKPARSENRCICLRYSEPTPAQVSQQIVGFFGLPCQCMMRPHVVIHFAGQGTSSMEREFANKVVLVTGATSGIGQAAALKFAAAGADIAAVGRNQEALAGLSAKLDAHGSKVSRR